MKKFFCFLMPVAVAGLAFCACNKEVENPVPEDTVVKKTLRFSAYVKNDDSKATLTTSDDKSFIANWEVGDRINVDCYKENDSFGHNSMLADWNGSSFVSLWDFSTNEVPGVCHYDGCYPADLSTCEFEKHRTQIGNEFNSLYDLMVGSVTYENALLGENPDGGDIVIPMERITSIVYFHLTSDLDEPITSATLTVEGGAIAASRLKYEDGVLDVDYLPSNSIVITFPKGQAPSARDFRLWFNILPVEATSLTLKVTTDTKMATLSNTTGKSFIAGKLNKIVKNGLNWVDDPDAAEPVTVAQFIEKEPGATYYKLTGTVQGKVDGDGSFYLNDGTGSVFINQVTEKDDPIHSYCSVFDGDEITVIGTRDERDREAMIWNAYHFSHVYYPYFRVTPSIVEFEADDLWVQKEFEVWGIHFDSVLNITYESSAGDKSRFFIAGHHSIFPIVANLASAPYSEIITVTASDGKHSVQKQMEVRQKAGQGASTDINVTINGYNEENNL